MLQSLSNLVRVCRHHLSILRMTDAACRSKNCLPAVGSWKLLVFMGAKRGRDMEVLKDTARAFQENKHMLHVARAPRKRFPRVETILILPRIEPSTRGSVNHSGCQPFAHAPTNTVADTSDIVSAAGALHATETHQPYKDYGIDETTGCMILCRPDQHIAWIGNTGGWANLDNFFSLCVRNGKSEQKEP